MRGHRDYRAVLAADERAIAETDRSTAPSAAGIAMKTPALLLRQRG